MQEAYLNVEGSSTLEVSSTLPRDRRFYMNSFLTPTALGKKRLQLTYELKSMVSATIDSRGGNLKLVSVSMDAIFNEIILLLPAYRTSPYRTPSSVFNTMHYPHAKPSRIDSTAHLAFSNRGKTRPL